MSLILNAQLAVKTEPVATWFKMPWKYHLPCLSLEADIIQAALHLASEAAPWVLSQRTGYALMSVARMASHLYQLVGYQREYCKKFSELKESQCSSWEKTKITLGLASTFSPLLMVVSRMFPTLFIVGQAGKTLIELGENISPLLGKNKLSVVQRSDKIFTIVSHSLYLAALWRTKSYEIRLASILFQGSVCVYQALKLSKKGQRIQAIVWALLGAVRFYSGYRYYLLKTASEPQYVYKQRHAEKNKKIQPSPLSEKGHEQARKNGPVVEKWLQEKTGKTEWNYAASTIIRSRQTAERMLEGVGRPQQTILLDARLQENLKNEPPSYQHARHAAAVDDLLDEFAEPGKGLLIVDHQVAGREYARGVELSNAELAHKRPKYMDGYLFKRQNGQTELVDRFYLKGNKKEEGKAPPLRS
ncbi:MAG: histidine phosphatase family protein [Verrucomicrobia bacterium]|nr:histidine phosphatase family protein [Verrucomicrobiota bacterium]